MDTSLKENLFWEIQDLMIKNEQKLMQMNSFEDKNIPLQVNEVYDQINQMKKLPHDNPFVAELNKFISDIANRIKLFSIHFTNYAHCPSRTDNEAILKEKADHHLAQTKQLYDEYTKKLPDYIKPIAEQIYCDMFSVAVKEHPQITLLATDGSNIGLCGNVKKSVTKLVADAKLKQQESRQQNAMSWFVDEMYDYIINGNISANAKEFITHFSSKKAYENSTFSLPESQLTNSDFKNKADKISYYIRDKEYKFKDEVTFSNFMNSRAVYFANIMNGNDYTKIINLNNILTRDYHKEDEKFIIHENAKIDSNFSTDYKSYITIQAYSANRNIVLATKHEYNRGFIRDEIFKYEI